MATTKLEQQLLEKINNLREKYQNTTYSLGQILIQREEINDELKRLKAQEDALIRLYSDTKKEEDAIIEELLKKYGEGSLDMKNGTYTT